ncbi:bifunctional phosphoserine phosphatase/homoserine phosphotransferase ThrH, partial [Petrachloros mirabilis]
MNKPVLVCLDLEGVLVPEIWINVALKTGIEKLKITTREMPDYDALMKQRLSILDEHKLTIADIQDVIDKMGPLDGAPEFVRWLRERCQVIILSDTFYQFALPLMRQLGFPTLFCNQLDIDQSGKILAHHMRMQNQKKHSVAAFKSLNFFTMAAGDAYNDTAMLGEADAGFFFRPPDHLPKEYPQFPVTQTYAELQSRFA